MEDLIREKNSPVPSLPSGARWSICTTTRRCGTHALSAGLRQCRTSLCGQRAGRPCHVGGQPRLHHLAGCSGARRAGLYRNLRDDNGEIPGICSVRKNRVSNGVKHRKKAAEKIANFPIFLQFLFLHRRIPVKTALLLALWSRLHRKFREM